MWETVPVSCMYKDGQSIHGDVYPPPPNFNDAAQQRELSTSASAARARSYVGLAINVTDIVFCVRKVKLTKDSYIPCHKTHFRGGVRHAMSHIPH